MKLTVPLMLPLPLERALRPFAKLFAYNAIRSTVWVGASRSSALIVSRPRLPDDPPTSAWSFEHGWALRQWTSAAQILKLLPRPENMSEIGVYVCKNGVRKYDASVPVDLPILPKIPANWTVCREMDESKESRPLVLLSEVPMGDFVYALICFVPPMGGEVPELLAYGAAGK